MLSENLLRLRKLHNLSQEAVAEKLGVTRQAAAKWENGESTPDIVNCIGLAKLYGVSLDELVQYEEASMGLPIPPRGKHIFGTVTVGDKGQLVIPKKAREIFGIAPGDRIVVLGDEAQGLALVREENMVKMLEAFRAGMGSAE